MCGEDGEVSGRNIHALRWESGNRKPRGEVVKWCGGVHQWVFNDVMIQTWNAEQSVAVGSHKNCIFTEENQEHVLCFVWIDTEQQQREKSWNSHREQYWTEMKAKMKCDCENWPPSGFQKYWRENTVCNRGTQADPTQVSRRKENLMSRLCL